MEEIDADEGTLCDAKYAGMGIALDIEFGPLSQRKLDEDYIQKNDIEYVFKSIIAGLMMKRPSDHVNYIENRLKELKLERDRAKIQITLIALKAQEDGSECNSAPPPKRSQIDLKNKQSWTQFADPLHPQRSVVKTKLYLDCSEVKEVECEEEEDNMLKQPVSLHDLASRIVIERNTNMFDVPVIQEPLILDVGKINNKPLFNFPDEDVQ